MLSAAHSLKLQSALDQSSAPATLRQLRFFSNMSSVPNFSCVWYFILNWGLVRLNFKRSFINREKCLRPCLNFHGQIKNLKTKLPNPRKGKESWSVCFKIISLERTVVYWRSSWILFLLELFLFQNICNTNCLRVIWGTIFPIETVKLPQVQYGICCLIQIY